MSDFNQNCALLQMKIRPIICFSWIVEFDWLVKMILIELIKPLSSHIFLSNLNLLWYVIK